MSCAYHWLWIVLSLLYARVVDKYFEFIFLIEMYYATEKQLIRVSDVAR